jgi:translation initiation factor eIF-2B subunit epsilon
VLLDAVITMAPKKKQGASADFKQEDVLQAVVIADSFNKRFAPITADRPRVRRMV